MNQILSSNQGPVRSSLSLLVQIPAPERNSPGTKSPSTGAAGGGGTGRTVSAPRMFPSGCAVEVPRTVPPTKEEGRPRDETVACDAKRTTSTGKELTPDPCANPCA